MARSLMICTNANQNLRLNESENLPGRKYILEGIFAELDTLNRNQRIYPKDEYLKHLQYLRADIKKGEPLLGELDHPDDRFEVKLKEASHRVIDLWYDSAKNVVMGKIELLNTPNGLLAQSIVDQGIPLHISSRAAGTVNNDNTVSIQQIYTYDLVCKPGFAGCVLYRVAESADAKTYSDDVRNFLLKAYKSESLNSAPQYGFVNEGISISEMKAPAVLRKEAQDIQINKQMELNEDMSKPLLENNNPDATVGKPLNISGGGAAALGIPTADIGGTNETKDSDKSDKEDKKASTDVSDNAGDKKDSKDEKCPKCGKEDCECKECDEPEASAPSQKTNESDDEESEDKDDDNTEEKDSDDSEDEDNSDDKKESTGVEILNVEPEFEESDNKDKDDDIIKDVEPEYGNKKSDDEDSEDEEETSESEDASTDEDDKNSKEAEKLNDKAVKDIEKHKDSIFKKLDDLQAAIEKKNRDKKESKNESIIMARYPMSMHLTESNFAKFASLSESQKNKVMNYINDKQITTVKALNENWENGINYVSPEPVWLKYAPQTYRSLYESASQQVKDNLATSAKYLLFENQNDVNIFWENSGLTEANERKLINESFVNNMPKVAAKVEEDVMPYSKNFIQQIADMASEYNTHRY